MIYDLELHNILDTSPSSISPPFPQNSSINNITKMH